MPIYEYFCENCGRKFSLLLRKPEDKAICPGCGSEKLHKLMSTFRVGKPRDYARKGVYEDILSDSRLIKGMMSNDPRALAEWNRRMMRASEMEVGPEYDEMLGRLEKGEPIEKATKEILKEE